MERAERVGQLLVEHGWRISVAESTAGGLISAALLKVPGASRYFERGVVAYSRAAKLDTLGMPSTLYTAQGSVHREAVKAMAEGCDASVAPRSAWEKAVWLARPAVAPAWPLVPYGLLW
jgi:PncC family amidohydrolase